MAARPGEITLTKVLDPVLEVMAKEMGVNTEPVSTIVGGEALGSLVEVVCDSILRGWLNKAVQGGVGLASLLAAIFYPNIPGRLRLELLELGTHSGTRIIDPKPSDIRELLASINEAVSAIQKGDVAGLLKSGLRAPEEWEAVSRMVRRAPTPTPTPRPRAGTVVRAPATRTPTPTPTKTKGRYTITG